MNDIEYVHDFDNTMETPFVFVLEEHIQEPGETQKKKVDTTPITLDSYKAAQRVYNPIQRTNDVKPYKGDVVKPPEKMIFATWNDHVAYTLAWESRVIKSKRKAKVATR
jgi:hypothetical protein